jgi:hypothetical protein
MNASSKETIHDPGKTIAATLVAPLVAFFVSAALIAALPVREELAFAIGAQVFIPLWVTLACALPLARNGRRALGGSAVVLVLAALVLVLRRLS